MAVQPNGLVENSGALGRHMNWWPLGSAVPWPPPCTDIPLKVEKGIEMQISRKFFSMEQHFQMIYHLSLGHISFYISTICRYIERYIYK